MHEIRKPVVSDTSHITVRGDATRLCMGSDVPRSTKGHIEKTYSSLAIEQRRSFQGLTMIDIVSM